MLMFFDIPNVISVRNDRLVFRKAFEEFDFRKKKSDAQLSNEKNLRFNNPSGHINSKIRLRMSKIINNWIACVDYINESEVSVKKRIFTFVTLTLPAAQFHTDKELHRMALDRWLIHSKRKFSVKNFLWRAERQRNGNIHYHIIVDNYIHHQVIRLSWNAIMKDLGYINLYKKNQELKHNNGFYFDKKKSEYWNYDKQLKAYSEGIATDWSNPNSTDIHSLKSVKDAAKYIMKYVSKSDSVDDLQLNEKNFEEKKISEIEYNKNKVDIQKILDADKINGKVWGCSDAIKELKDAKIFESVEVVQLMAILKNDKETKNIEIDSTIVVYNKRMQEYVARFRSISSQIREQHRVNYLLSYGKDFRKNKNIVPVQKVEIIWEKKEKIIKVESMQIQLEFS